MVFRSNPFLSFMHEDYPPNTPQFPHRPGTITRSTLKYAKESSIAHSFVALPYPITAFRAQGVVVAAMYCPAFLQGARIRDPPNRNRTNPMNFRESPWIYRYPSILVRHIVTGTSIARADSPLFLNTPIVRFYA